MENQLWKKIPVDIFINHIMPYVYKKQDTNLLHLFSFKTPIL